MAAHTVPGTFNGQPVTVTADGTRLTIIDVTTGASVLEFAGNNISIELDTDGLLIGNKTRVVIDPGDYTAARAVRSQYMNAARNVGRPLDAPSPVSATAPARQATGPSGPAAHTTMPPAPNPGPVRAIERQPVDAYTRTLCARLDTTGGVIRMIAILGALGAAAIGAWLVFRTEISEFDGSTEHPYISQGVVIAVAGITQSAVIYLAGLWASAWAHRNQYH